MRRSLLVVVGVVVVMTIAAVAIAACRGSSDTVPVGDRARAAMLDVRAAGCGPNLGFGTSTLIDDTLALTAAHVVAGASSVSVIDLLGGEHDARVVWFDPDLDLAALRVPAGIATPVPVSVDGVEQVERGVAAVSRGAHDERTVTTIDIAVPRHVNIATTDIYLDDEVVRPGFEILATIEPGDSGTMVVTPDGAAGVVWSRSNATERRAWAVDVPAEFAAATFRSSLDTVTDVGACLN